MAKVFQTLELRKTLEGNPQNKARLNAVFGAVLFGMPSPNDYLDMSDEEFLRRHGVTKEKFKSAYDFEPEQYTKVYEEKEAVYKKALIHFKNTFKSDIFYNEYDIFYQIITQYTNSKFGIDDLEQILDDNRHEILNSKYVYCFDDVKEALRQNSSAPTEDEYFANIKVKLTAFYRKLSYYYVSWEDYLTNCDTYISAYKKEYTMETLLNSSAALNTGGMDVMLNGKKTTIYTTEDVLKYWAERETVLSELGVSESATGIVFDSNYLASIVEAKQEPGLLDYGIEDIDEVKSKMRRGNVVCIMGPPKGGKTTFTTYLVERALSMGLNVAVWPLEGTKEEWIALLLSIATMRATAADIIANSAGGDAKPAKEVYRSLAIRNNAKDSATSETIGQFVAPTKSDILYNRLDDVQGPKVETTRLAMANQVGYGKLSFVDGIAYVENFDEILNTHYDTLNKFDVLVMDSPINMQSLQRRPKSEYLSQAFQKLKAYVANKVPSPVLAIVTAQYKQSAIDEIRARDKMGDKHKEIDVTAGGETAESIRTPDDVIGLFSDAEERANGKMRLYDIASRGNEHFKPFYIGCALGHGMFWSDKDLNPTDS